MKIISRLAKLFFAFMTVLTVQAEDAPRIISLSPSMTEIVCELGFRPNLAGRSDACNYPETVDDVPVAGHFGEPALQKLLSLHPTLVLTTSAINPLVFQRLQSEGIHAEILPCRNLQEYSSAVAELGKLLSVPQISAAEIQKMKLQENLARERPRFHKTALWVIWDNPLMIAGKRSFLHEVMDLAGLDNAAADIDSEYITVKKEWLIQHQPDLIIWSAAPQRSNFLKDVEFWQDFEAVRNHFIWEPENPDLVLRPGPRLFQGVDALRLKAESLFAAPEAPSMQKTLLAQKIRRMNLERLLAAFLIGGSLALTGLIFQAILQNPLAEPFTLGLSGGAGVGAALAVILGLTALSFFAVPVCAFLGALLSFFLVLQISRGASGGTERLLLSGVMVGTLASGILLFLLMFSTKDELAGVLWWMLGDLQAVPSHFLYLMSVLSPLLLILFQISAGNLNALSLGQEQAFYLGISVRRNMLFFLIGASLLAAGTVVMAGIIGFCGLVVPHLIRRLVSSDHRKNIIPTYLAGGLFLTVSDLISRSISDIREIPIGIVTALIGAPFFLYILNRRSRGND